MKEKEWKKEQKIPLLPVEFPEDSVMQKECRAIVEKAIPKRQSLWERSKEIYWGPGIRAIFYQSGSIWLIVACLYLGIGWLGQLYAKQPETQMIIVFLGFPVCFLVFAVLAVAALAAGVVAYWQQKKAENLLGQTQQSLEFMNWELRPVLEQYVKTEVKEQLISRMEDMLKTLKPYQSAEQSYLNQILDWQYLNSNHP